MKHKIGIFLTAQPHDGGAYQFSQSIVEAAAALPRNNFETIFYFEAEDWLPQLQRRGVKHFGFTRNWASHFFDSVWRRAHLPIGLWRKLPPLMSGLAERVLSEKCALWVFPAQDSFAYQFPVPSLGVIFDLMHRYEPSFPEVSAYGRGSRRDYHYMALCSYAQGVMVDSEVGKQQVMESYGVASAKLQVLPFTAPSYIQEAVNKDLPRDPRLPGKYIFYPAQFWKHKNHSRLLEAVKSLSVKYPEIRLVLSGSSKNGYEDVVRQCESEGLKDNVVFLGYVPAADLPGLYKHARALVMPTFFGPTNIPPLEAFFMGCPVACSGIYGMPEQVGDAALLFSPLSVPEIAAAIERLWTDDDLCRKLSANGLRRAQVLDEASFKLRFLEIVNRLVC